MPPSFFLDWVIFFFFFERAPQTVCKFWKLISCWLHHLWVFSHSVGCLLIFLMVFFAMQKPLSLIRSHLLIFVFIFIILGGELGQTPGDGDGLGCLVSYRPWGCKESDTTGRLNNKGGGFRKIFLWFMSETLLPMFSSKSIIVFGLTFRTLNHFEFIFV